MHNIVSWCIVLYPSSKDIQSLLPLPHLLIKKKKCIFTSECADLCSSPCIYSEGHSRGPTPKYSSITVHFHQLDFLVMLLRNGSTIKRIRIHHYYTQYKLLFHCLIFILLQAVIMLFKCTALCLYA
jgi:hypothetical protein